MQRETATIQHRYAGAVAEGTGGHFGEVTDPARRSSPRSSPPSTGRCSRTPSVRSTGARRSSSSPAGSTPATGLNLGFPHND